MALESKLGRARLRGRPFNKQDRGRGRPLGSAHEANDAWTRMSMQSASDATGIQAPHVGCTRLRCRCFDGVGGRRRRTYAPGEQGCGEGARSDRRRESNVGGGGSGLCCPCHGRDSLAILC